MPATAVPITEPVTKFQNIQGQPHPGIAKEISVSGNIISSPQRGPRRYH